MLALLQVSSTSARGILCNNTTEKNILKELFLNDVICLCLYFKSFYQTCLAWYWGLTLVAILL